jgi:hypothetical protein
LLHDAVLEGSEGLDFGGFGFLASVNVAQEVPTELEVVTTITTKWGGVMKS